MLFRFFFLSFYVKTNLLKQRNSFYKVVQNEKKYLFKFVIVNGTK